MMFLSMIPGARDLGIATLSISFWGGEVINSIGWVVWNDYNFMFGQALIVDPFAQVALWTVWYSPFPTTTPLLNLVVSIVALLVISLIFVLIGQSTFKQRELN